MAYADWDSCPMELYAQSRSPVTMPDEHRACVLWDLFDFSFDERKPSEIYESTKRSLEKFVSSEINESEITERALEKFVSFGDLSINAYAHEEKVTDELVRHYKEGGITIIPVPDDECARVQYMITDILMWTMENPSDCPYSLNVCVMSKLVKRESLFREILLKVGHLDYNVILALPPPDHLSSRELPFVNLLDGDKPNDREKRG